MFTFSFFLYSLLMWLKENTCMPDQKYTPDSTFYHNIKRNTYELAKPIVYKWI